MRLDASLLGLARHVRGLIVLGVGLGLALLVVTVLRGVLLAAALAVLLVPDVDGPMGALLLGVAAAQIGRSGLLWAREVAAQRTGAAIKVRLREVLVRRLAALGPDHPVTARSGQVQALLVDGVEGLESYFARYLPQVVITLIGPLMILVAIATADLVTAAALAAIVVLVPTLPRVWDRLLARRGDEYWTRYRDLAGDYVEAMQAMPVIVVAGAAGPVREALAMRSAGLLEATMRQMAVSLVSSAVSTGAATAGTALAVAVGALRVEAGALAPEALLLVLLLAGECLRPFSDLANAWHSSYVGVAAARGVADLLAAPDPPPMPATPTAPADGGAIRLRGVTVHWPDRPEPALRDVELDIAAGSVVGFTGPSGAGKSTVLAVLAGMVEPASGEVWVGGHDAGALDPRALRGLVTLVPQHPVLLDGSIADNVRLGGPGASEAAVAQAALDAGLGPLLAELPDGIDTPVGDRGGRLSGGERQRVALARALLADPPILALDEVTSAVDDATEHDVVTRVATVRQGRTTLVVAHRPGALAHVDRVVHLIDGRVLTDRPRPSAAVAGPGGLR